MITCSTCGKEIVLTANDLTRQSMWRHADGSGSGVGERVRDQWCETEGGFVKVNPPAITKHSDLLGDLLRAAGTED